MTPMYREWLITEMTKIVDDYELRKDWGTTQAKIDADIASYRRALEAAKHDQVGCPPEPQNVAPFKPPMDICSESFALSVQNHKRIGDILAAMNRYHAACKPIPLEWVEWLKQRVESQKKLRDEAQ